MLIDEQRSAVQTFLSSPLIHQYEIRARIWLEVLTRIATTIHTWLQAQRLCFSFGSLFYLADLPQLCPHETRRFEAVDSAWQKLMESVIANPHVLTDYRPHEKIKVSIIIRICQVILESFQTFFRKYLHGEIAAFSRLFFLSNEELHGIFLFMQEPTESIPHLLKLFPFVSSVILRNTSPVETLASQTAKSPRTTPEKRPPADNRYQPSHISTMSLSAADTFSKQKGSFSLLCNPLHSPLIFLQRSQFFLQPQKNWSHHIHSPLHTFPHSSPHRLASHTSAFASSWQSFDPLASLTSRHPPSKLTPQFVYAQ